MILTLPRARGQQQVKNQERDPDVDGGVSDIEDEKVPSKSVQIEIVDDGPVRNPIDCVAESAAEAIAVAQELQGDLNLLLTDI